MLCLRNMEKDIEAILDLELVAKQLARELANQSSDKAMVLALYGELGAGKTTFMQTLAKELGVVDTVNSPTFVVMKSYDLKDQPWQKLIHIDAYRIEDEDEMDVIKLPEIMQDPGNLIGIEWADKVSKYLPEDVVNLHFNLDNRSRTLSINGL
ncbi:tRNA (adenosine(37)-N6)-threonylcarbamoyltransferase complex ATPase subunit type 1 TsaE [bacterium]|nr:tRNA (adenosine(37)-N6)-threonylcarbamoyltransferase complex ATPase subunit type 1 TsaE [bacterium]